MLKGVKKQREITDRLTTATKKANGNFPLTTWCVKIRIRAYYNGQKMKKTKFSRKQLNHQMERSKTAPFSGEQKA